MAMNEGPAAVLLAAGRGSRLGGQCKALVTVNGQPLLIQQCTAMWAAGIRRMVVVVGAQAEAVNELIAQCRDRFQDMAIDIVQMQTVSDDQQDSVRAAMAYLSKQGMLDGHDSGVLISLVDLPLLSAADIAAVVQRAGVEKAKAANHANSIQAVVPTSPDGQPGHPLWIGAQLSKQFADAGSVGSLRALIAQNLSRNAESVVLLTSDAPGYFTDIDTPEDIADISARYRLTIDIGPR